VGTGLTQRLFEEAGHFTSLGIPARKVGDRLGEELCINGHQPVQHRRGNGNSYGNIFDHGNLS